MNLRKAHGPGCEGRRWWEPKYTYLTSICFPAASCQCGWDVEISTFVNFKYMALYTEKKTRAWDPKFGSYGSLKFSDWASEHFRSSCRGSDHTSETSVLTSEVFRCENRSFSDVRTEIFGCENRSTLDVRTEVSDVWSKPQQLDRKCSDAQSENFTDPYDLNFGSHARSFFLRVRSQYTASSRCVVYLAASDREFPSCADYLC